MNLLSIRIFVDFRSHGSDQFDNERGDHDALRLPCEIPIGPLGGRNNGQGCTVAHRYIAARTNLK